MDYTNIPAKSSVYVQNILSIAPPPGKPKKANMVEIKFMAKDKIRPNGKNPAMQTSAMN